ncbi:hypothetical protein VA7868_01372 [Vibrio aerogenes CECT 7868]|uniref:Uncharacterized protein n=1 Tax=Vibrio aerogenes CECT 7868 TaxID=1216006 RepID=A0A1M5XY74_9VIBR|nr:hypothetical protein [Vibrio aerogenes]SHI04777.1 hypothetical protein VA7868_01372 [Vibrio aerogenes CECT 7868]
MAYHPGAYNSRDFTPQPRPGKSSWYESLYRRGKRFAFTRADHKSIATSMIRNYKPSIHDDDDDSGMELFWDQNRLEPYTFVSWLGFYFFMAGLAKTAMYFITPIGVVLSMLPLFGTPGLEGAIYLVSHFLLYVTLPALIVYSPMSLINGPDWLVKGVGAKFFKKDNLSLFARKRFTLSRETGMVTLYGKGNRVIFSHPFIEFDCILMSNPNHQGLLSHHLKLVHRYHDYNEGAIGLGSMCGMHLSQEEYLRVWNMIQQYMDVSQPLPDIPILEPFREQDETTAAHDKKTGRNPTYWREMSDEDYAKKLDEIIVWQREEHIPATGPELNIFESA